MKYEIIKGSEKDFDGAPEWATMICYCSLEVPPRISERNMAFTDGINKWCSWQQIIDHTLTGTIDDESQWFIIAERRPITELVWSGEGLPPVGVECETLNKEIGRWYKVRIIFSDLKRRVAWEELQESYLNIDCDNSADLREFRPIRSPEDVARDEAIVLLTGIICGKIPDVGMGTAAMFAGRVYDAGYRKVEVK